MIGQRCIQQQIKSEIEGKSLARFIILVGERGSGRKTLAKEIARLTDAEYVVVDKGVDAIREIIEQSYTIATEILYVLDGDNMSPSAKSSLLKVTEEPPNKARFVLTVSDISQTINTLTSRARVFRMDMYTDADIAYFAGTEDTRYANFCTNKYEVDLLKGYGIDAFTEFVDLVVDNVAEVSSANAFKIEERVALKGEENKYDVKVLLQAFRVVCMRRVQDSEDYQEKMKFLQWVQTTSEILADLRISTINKPMLFDKWIFNVREVARECR